MPKYERGVPLHPSSGACKLNLQSIAIRRANVKKDLPHQVAQKMRRQTHTFLLGAWRTFGNQMGSCTKYCQQHSSPKRHNAWKLTKCPAQPGAVGPWLWQLHDGTLTGEGDRVRTPHNHEMGLEPKKPTREVTSGMLRFHKSRKQQS